MAVVAALIGLGAGIGIGVAIEGGSDEPSASGTPSMSPSYASPASEVPTSADPTTEAETPEDTPPPSASVLALGASLSLESTNSTSGDTATADVIVYGIEAHASSSDGYETPKGQYVKVDVGTTGTSTASFPYNELDFVLQDAAGQIYQPTFASGFDPTYNSGDIAQGQSVRGFILFDIPAAATVQQVNYQVPSGVLGSWTLPR